MVHKLDLSNPLHVDVRRTKAATRQIIDDMAHLNLTDAKKLSTETGLAIQDANPLLQADLLLEPHLQVCSI